MSFKLQRDDNNESRAYKGIEGQHQPTSSKALMNEKKITNNTEMHKCVTYLPFSSKISMRSFRLLQ